MTSISAPSVRVIFLLVVVTIQRIIADPISMTISIISKFSGVMVPKMATGNPKTIQMLKMLLPTMLPTRRSCSPRRAAVIVVTSSGNEVPSAMIVREIIRSEIPIEEATNEAEFTTSWLPATTPTRPIRIMRKDLLSLCLGFSTSFLTLRFLRVV